MPTVSSNLNPRSLLNAIPGHPNEPRPQKIAAVCCDVVCFLWRYRSVAASKWRTLGVANDSPGVNRRDSRWDMAEAIEADFRHLDDSGIPNRLGGFSRDAGAHVLRCLYTYRTCHAIDGARSSPSQETSSGQLLVSKETTNRSTTLPQAVLNTLNATKVIPNVSTAIANGRLRFGTRIRNFEI